MLTHILKNSELSSFLLVIIYFMLLLEREEKSENEVTAKVVFSGA